MELEQALGRQIPRRTALKAGIGFLLYLLSGVSWRDTRVNPFNKLSDNLDNLIPFTIGNNDLADPRFQDILFRLARVLPRLELSSEEFVLANTDNFGNILLRDTLKKLRVSRIDLIIDKTSSQLGLELRFEDNVFLVVISG